MSETAQPNTRRGTSESIEPGRGEQTAARRAAEVKATVPDAVFFASADASAALEIVAADPATTVADVAVAALACALRSMPEANAAYRDARFERFTRINVGVVTPALPAGAAVTIFDADTLSAREIAATREELTGKAAEGTITAPETGGATCSVIDLSGSRVEAFTPLLTPPHALALGVGAAAAAAVVADGELTVRPLAGLSLTTDQRIIGACAAAALLDRIAAGFESATT